VISQLEYDSKAVLFIRGKEVRTYKSRNPIYIKRNGYLPVNQKNESEENCLMKNIVTTIILFAIAIGLIVGVIVPIAQHGRTTAATAKTSMTGIDTSITSLSVPIQ
jgi:hypothetical protein